MSLKQVAEDTLTILERGRYENAAGAVVEIAALQRAAVEGTKTYVPDELEALLAVRPSTRGNRPTVDVTSERTQEAAQRMARQGDVAVLNFASARNPGGGFINGAKAQEEDLSRCSGLYACLAPQHAYYDANRKQASLLYTDHLIFSPRVPFFRTRSRNLVDVPFSASIITAPAPNARQVLAREKDAEARIERTLRRRAGYVLAVAAYHGHRNLVLGAWGCGVFGNDPAKVADSFATWLDAPRFHGAFDLVVFAILDKSTELTRGPFRDRFSGWGAG